MLAGAESRGLRNVQGALTQVALNFGDASMVTRNDHHAEIQREEPVCTHRPCGRLRPQFRRLGIAP